MSVKKLQAKFVGEQGSLTLVTGKFYDLEFEEFSDVAKLRTNCRIRVKIIKSPLNRNNFIICDYSSAVAFLNNWNCIMVKS